MRTAYLFTHGTPPVGYPQPHHHVAAGRRGARIAIIVQVDLSFLSATPMPARVSGAAPRTCFVNETGYRPHVLVIDDEESVRAAIEASIDAVGEFDVDTVPDGATCLDMVAKTRYDLVLVDLVMPLMDGFELLRRLRLLPEAQQPKRIVVVSAMVDPVLLGSVRELGGDDVMGKPFRLEDLRRVLEAA